MPYDRAEFDEFWQDWLDINRTAQRIGDWTVMAGRAAIGKPTRALPSWDAMSAPLWPVPRILD